MDINMDKILSAKLGESKGSIRVSFKKTINIRQYETEVTEMESVLDLDTPIEGAERALVAAILQAQLEYTTFISLRFKEQITDAEFVKRREEIVAEIATLKAKAEAITGRSMDKYL